MPGHFENEIKSQKFLDLFKVHQKFNSFCSCVTFESLSGEAGRLCSRKKSNISLFVDDIAL